MTRRHSGSHAITWGAITISSYIGFLRAYTRRRGIVVPRFNVKLKAKKGLRGSLLIMKKVKFFIGTMLTLLCSIVLFLIACSEDESGSGNEGDSKNPYTLVLNVDDPEFLIYDNGTEVVHLYGDKNSDGSVRSINSIVLEDNENGNTILNVDEQMRPTHIIVSDIVYDITWNSNTTGVLSAYDEENNLTITVAFDKESELYTEPYSTSRSTNIRTGEFKYKFVPAQETAALKSKTGIETRTADDGNQECIVTFEKCDDYYDPTSVYLNVFREKGNGFITSIYSYDKIGTGQYSFKIPSDTYPSISTAEIAKSIDTVLGYIGAISDYLADSNGDVFLCGALAVGVAALQPELIVVADKITGACVGINRVISALNKLNTGGTDSGASVSGAVIDYLAQANILKKVYTDNLVICPIINGTAGKSPEVVMTPEDSKKVIEIITEGEPLLQRFYLDPSEPAQGQDYVAYATVHCMPYGANVKMHIIGTDGYENTQNTTLTSPNGVIELWVPGAATGVRDVVDVYITDENGEYISSATASLVFN